MNKTTSIIIAIIVIVGGFWYLSTKKPSVPAKTTRTAQPIIETQSPSLQESTNTKSFTVEGGNFSFMPNNISVRQGDTVQITFTNVEGFHDLVIDELNIKTKQLSAGQKETIQFVADKVGTFEYYCSVGSHRAMGMVGTLEVK